MAVVNSPSTESDLQSKRKASTAGLSSSNRPVKRRASKACCCCRARKVRCDVVESGSPCTNCRLDQVECVVTESKRRKLVHVKNYHVPTPIPFLTCQFLLLLRKSRMEVESTNSIGLSTCPSDENGSLFGRPADGLPVISPASPQNSVKLDQCQHMPHLLCSYSLQIPSLSPLLITPTRPKPGSSHRFQGLPAWTVGRQSFSSRQPSSSSNLACTTIDELPALLYLWLRRSATGLYQPTSSALSERGH